MSTTFREMNAQTRTLRAEFGRFGLSPDASEEEINASFRRLSKRAHPDAGGSPELFDDLLATRERLLRAARGEAAQTLERIPPTPPATSSPGSTGIAEFLTLFDGSQPVWVLGTIAALPVVILGGLAAVIRLDRSLIAGSLLGGLAIWVFVGVLVSIGRHHKANTQPDVLYRSAEEVVRLRANRIRNEQRRRAAEARAGD